MENIRLEPFDSGPDGFVIPPVKGEYLGHKREVEIAKYLEAYFSILKVASGC
jgi:hypothetical protein